MCFPRRPGLGCYNASRSEWILAYWLARMARQKGEEPDPKQAGINWKACLIVNYERDTPDRLSGSAINRLAVKRLIDEICREDVQ